MKQRLKTKLRPIPDIPSKAALLALPKADPYWDLKLTSAPITGAVRRLRAVWTLEDDQQVMARHNVNCFDAVTDALADRVYDYP